MAGAKGCMLEFNGDTKLTSEEFVKVFKEFDKDGEYYEHFKYSVVTAVA